MKNFQKKPQKNRLIAQNSPKQPTQNPPNSLPKNVAIQNAVIQDEISDFGKVNYICVSEHQDGQRIDNFLLTLLKGLPRSHIYKLIRDKEITLNKKRIKPHDRIATGDVVRIAPVRLSVKDKPVVSDKLANHLLNRIIFEDDGLIVIDKPFGMAVHGGSGVSAGVIETLRVATNKKYLELVHRIDKDTSGLLLIAKKRSTLKALQDSFRQKTVQKSYLCVVLGHLDTLEKVIDKPLLKYTLANKDGTEQRRVRVDNLGKSSVTKIQVLSKFVLDDVPISLVLASPLTGRTHQIRVHLASIGHPLLGDDKYLTKPAPSVRRLCLHAYKLSLPTGQHFVAPLPDDLKVLCADVLADID